MLYPRFHFSIAAAITLSCCISPVSGESFFRVKDKGTSFLILPDIDTDPNEGETFGLLPIWMFKNEAGEVQRMIAPSLNFNELAGVTGTFRLFDYPATESEMTVIASISENTNLGFLFNYIDRQYHGSRYLIGGRVEYSRNGFARFYGIGPETSESSESNYSRNQLLLSMVVGAHLKDDLRLELQEKFRKVDIKRGLVNGIGDTRSNFFNLKGIDGDQLWSHQFSVIYDRRDSVNLTSKGIYAQVSGEFPLDFAFGHVDFARYTLDLRYFRPWLEGRSISSFRFMLESVTGDEIPFFELPSVGGRNSLRAFGDDRFVDEVRLVINFEQRFDIYRRHVFGIDAEFEVAPFVDLGVVGRDYSRLSTGNLKPVAGIGFRGMTRPDILGRIDIGIGEEGPQIFLGLGYMF